MPYRYTAKDQRKARLLEWFGWIVLLPFTRRSDRARKPDDRMRILLVEPFQMGDILSMTPMVNPLLAAFPHAEIYFLTKPSSAAILRLDKRVTRVLEFDFVWSDYGVKRSMGIIYGLKLLRQLVQLRSYDFDIGFDTRGDIRSQIVLVLTGCRQRLGYTRYLASNLSIHGRLLSKQLPGKDSKHRYDWNSALLPLAGCENQAVRLPSFFPELDPISFHKPFQRFILLHVGGGWEFKRWANDRWAQLIDTLNKEVQQNLVIIGGPAENGVIMEVERLTLNHDRTLFQVTTLTELVALEDQCDLFIGLDSGPMNLAVCLGKPVVALFGPGDSSMWYPYGSPNSAIHHVERFPCNPCKQVACEFPGRSCMSEIAVDEVVARVREKLTL